MTDHDPLLYPRHYPLTRQTNRFCNTKIHLACTITSVSDSCRYGGRRIYLSSWSPPLEGRSCAFLRGGYVVYCLAASFLVHPFLLLPLKRMGLGI
ncbi:hypothetical protein BDV40DRAFT_259557, partial [Aspergillus tamarii]